AEDSEDAQVVASCVRSLRVLETASWKEFFESVSETERALRDDPAGIYPRMDFETRDSYRKVVESVARRTRRPEEEIARAAVRMARTGSTPRSMHVGYYLAAAVSARSARDPNSHPDWITRWRRSPPQPPTLFYLGGIALGPLGVEASLAALLLHLGANGLLTALCLVLGAIPASTIGVSVINGIITRTLPPRVLPKMDFSTGMPADCQTAVAGPALLTDPQEIESLVHALEIRFLANQDPQLHFVLLTDFCDAPQATLAEDANLLQLAADRILALNTKYGRNNSSPFHLLHRQR